MFKFLLTPLLDGKPAADRRWVEVFGKLTGTVLAIWDADSLDSAGSQPPTPTYINITDCSLKSIPSLPSPNGDLSNIIVLSTTLKNRYLLQLATPSLLAEWTGALRLSQFENSSLHEAYTGALLSSKGSKLNGIRTLLSETKFRHEDYVSVRFGSGMPWKKCWTVVTPKDLKKKKNQPAPGTIAFYEDKKKMKKPPLAVITGSYASYAVYPQSSVLVNGSTLIKIEGKVTFNDVEGEKDASVFLMPETHAGVPGFETLIRFLIPVLDAFQLYGRPSRLNADKADLRSLLFGMPTLPFTQYLETSDVQMLLGISGSDNWTPYDWTRNIKDLLARKMSTGYKGTGKLKKHGSVSAAGTGPGVLPHSVRAARDRSVSTPAESADKYGDEPSSPMGPVCDRGTPPIRNPNTSTDALNMQGNHDPSVQGSHNPYGASNGSNSTTSLNGPSGPNGGPNSSGYNPNGPNGPRPNGPRPNGPNGPSGFNSPNGPNGPGGPQGPNVAPFGRSNMGTRPNMGPGGPSNPRMGPNGPGGQNGPNGPRMGTPNGNRPNMGPGGPDGSRGPNSNGPRPNMGPNGPDGPYNGPPGRSNMGMRPPPGDMLSPPSHNSPRLSPQHSSTSLNSVGGPAAYTSNTPAARSATSISSGGSRNGPPNGPPNFSRAPYASEGPGPGTPPFAQPYGRTNSPGAGLGPQHQNREPQGMGPQSREGPRPMYNGLAPSRQAPAPPDGSRRNQFDRSASEGSHPNNLLSGINSSTQPISSLPGAAPQFASQPNRGGDNSRLQMREEVFGNSIPKESQSQYNYPITPTSPVHQYHQPGGERSPQAPPNQAAYNTMFDPTANTQASPYDSVNNDDIPNDRPMRTNQQKQYQMYSETPYGGPGPENSRPPGPPQGGRPPPGGPGGPGRGPPQFHGAPGQGQNSYGPLPTQGGPGQNPYGAQPQQRPPGQNPYGPRPPQGAQGSNQYGPRPGPQGAPQQQRQGGGDQFRSVVI